MTHENRANAPEKSITGGRVIKRASKRVMAALWLSFQRRGMTNHSPEGSMVWLVTEMLKEKKQSYTIRLLKLNDKVVGICVTKPTVNVHTSNDVISEIYETWSPT